jgi:uncharacterized membrane protein
MDSESSRSEPETASHGGGGSARVQAIGAAAAFVVWLCLRLFAAAASQVFSVSTRSGALPFLFCDLSVLALAPCLLLWRRQPPDAPTARGCVAALTLYAGLVYGSHALRRFYGGDALAWDLGNFLQPMWRSMSGLGMISTWHGDKPLWGDHGSFALYLFAPLTHLFEDAATGPLLAQAALTAAFVPACYALSRALGLSTAAALAIACVAATSRPLFYAATFDLHPECALPLLLALLLLAHTRGRFVACALLALLAASLKDMAALTTFGACTYLAVRDRAPKLALLACAVLCVALFDMFWLPALTGWDSYLSLNTSAPLDAGLAAKTTLMRALGTGLFGSLHPLGVLAGAPWTLAAAASPKLLVKGVQFQYSYFFVSSGLLGAIYLAAWLRRRSARGGLDLVLAWSLVCVAFNAPRPLNLRDTRAARASFEVVRAELDRLTAGHPQVATDACSAAYIMERPVLLPLCQIDLEHFARGGEERWDRPDPRALRAPLILARPDCGLHHGCLAEQLRRAQRLGYTRRGDAHGFLALQAPAARP